MSLNGRLFLCKVYRIIRSSNVGFSDQTVKNERKKFGSNITWNRLKILYQLKDYLKVVSHNSQSLSKQWIQVLQKLLEISSPFPSTFLKVTVVNSTKGTDVEYVKFNEIVKVDRKNYSYNLPMIEGWRTKHFQNEGSVKKNAGPSWTNNIDIPQSTNLDNRTRQLLLLIEHAESVQSRLKRIEDLNTFLLQHPEARLLAVKEGAIRKLLHVKRITKDYTTHKILREASALLGHFGPLPCKGIRILSIDGGGIRGIAVIEMLKKLEELTGKRIFESFDFICGVSTGSILVSCIGNPHGLTLDEALLMYEDFGTKLFTQSAFWGVSNLVLSRAYYDTTKFEQLLKKFVGEMPLIKTNHNFRCPRIAAVSTVMNHSSIMPFVFRNYSLPCDRQSQYLGSCKYSLFEAVRASGAAPTVFQEFCLDGIIHQDGGILMNNPCALAIHEAKLLWPDSEIQCVVSCGTGRHAPIKMAVQLSKMTSTISSVSWKTLFNRILESATDTEGVHTTLNDLLPSNAYFRFNPYLTDLIPMHENKPDKIRQVREETTLYIRRNEEKFIDAAHNLLIKRTATQRTRDFVNLKAFEYGFSNSA